MPRSNIRVIGDDSSDRSHIIRELGLSSRIVDGVGRLEAAILPTMHVPGTTNLRASILATFADVACGHLAMRALVPRVPVTLELDLHLHRPPADLTVLHAVSHTAKAGRSVGVFTVDFSDERGEPVAVANASFMAAPDPSVRIEPELAAGDMMLRTDGPRLEVPFVERAHCRRLGPGVATLPTTEEGLNASNTLNGGLIALVIEEAALSLAPGSTLASMALRYVRPVRVGPAVASATLSGGLGRVEVRDAGREDRLSVVATVRTFPP